MEIRKSAFINLWKQTPLQKSIAHARLHDLQPDTTVRKATDMTCQNAVFAVVLTSSLAGCDKQTPSNPGKQSDAPATRYQIFVESSGSETVDALVRQLVSNRPAPYPSGTPD